MPEVPEILYFKKYLKSTCLHQKIENVHTKDEQVLENTNAQGLGKFLTGRSFEDVSHHGKYIFMELDRQDDDAGLLMHFGMTGKPFYYKKESMEPEYSMVKILFKNEACFAFECPRKLGRLRPIDNFEAFIKEKGLGPDVSSDDFSLDLFMDLIKSKRGYIKTALMDQESMAGLGNECTDEILFQAGIHPKTKLDELSEKKLEEVYEHIQEVINIKSQALIHNNPLPDSFLLKYREKGSDCPNCDGSIETIKIGGRNSYFCPACQPE